MLGAPGTLSTQGPPGGPFNPSPSPSQVAPQGALQGAPSAPGASLFGGFAAGAASAASPFSGRLFGGNSATPTGAPSLFSGAPTGAAAAAAAPAQQQPAASGGSGLFSSSGSAAGTSNSLFGGGKPQGLFAAAAPAAPAGSINTQGDASRQTTGALSAPISGSMWGQGGGGAPYLRGLLQQVYLGAPDQQR